MRNDECNSSSITQTSSPELLAGRCGAAPAQLPVATQEEAVAALFELLLEASLPSPGQVPASVRLGQNQQASSSSCAPERDRRLRLNSSFLIHHLGVQAGRLHYPGESLGRTQRGGLGRGDRIGSHLKLAYNPLLKAATPGWASLTRPNGAKVPVSTRPQP